MKSNWKMMSVLAAFVAALVITSAPVWADDPCEHASLKAKCKRKAQINKAVIQLKRGPASTDVFFVITNGEGDDIIVPATTKKSGKAKAKVKSEELLDGDHGVSVWYIGENGRVLCVEGEFVCR